ncbi:unnamed protein product [Alternaria alternata]
MGPVPFVHAVREVLVPEPNGLRLKSDPDDKSYRWNFLNLEKVGNPRKSPKSPLEPVSPKPPGMEDIERFDKSSLFMMEWENFVDEG